ncbi:MAG: response regulator [Candidatus Eremiobacteraeota bacterium]|nr:response regulator [Candidatus Eremiobacteraeota bacterium]
MSNVKEENEIRYKEGDIVKGKVIKRYPNYVVVKIENNWSGRVHQREINWSKELKEKNVPKLKEGSEEDFYVLAVYEKGKRLKLSWRIARDDPWKRDSFDYNEGQIVRLHINSISGDYAVGEIEEGISARLPIKEVRNYYEDGVEEERLEKKDDIKLNIMSGDYVIGIIKKVDPSIRLIDVSIEEYLRIIEDVKIHPDRAISGQGEPFIFSESNVARTKHSTFTVPDNCSVLIANDDPPFLDAMKSKFERLGFNRVDTSETAEDAVKKTEEFDYDVILMDISIPTNGGKWACEKILEEKDYSKVILMTGNLESSHEIGICGLKIYGFIYLPFTDEELEEALDKALKGEIQQGIGCNRGLSDEPELSSPIFFSSSVIEKKDKDFRKEITEMLEKLRKEISADNIAIITLDPITYRSELFAYCNKYGVEEKVDEDGIKEKIDEERFYNNSDKMRYSPVRDVLEDKPHIIYSQNVSKRIGKFRYLRKVLFFDSCMGIPLHVPAEIGYSFFAFYKDINALKKINYEKFKAYAAQIESLIFKKKLYEWVESEHKFIVDGQLIAGLGHELNTRMAAFGEFVKEFKARIEDIEEKGKSLDLLYPTLEDIILEKDNIHRTADVFLRLFKKGREKFIPLVQIIKNVVDSAKPLARESGAKIDPQFDEGIDKDLKIDVGAEQVLFNLVINAIQQISLFFRKKGEVLIRIEPVNKQANRVRILVQDSGPGIHGRNFDPRFDQIFQPMYTTKEKGLGIGLSLARGIAKRIGGDLSVAESIMFVGSTFCLEIPGKY